jgi:hypothetical protein
MVTIIRAILCNVCGNTYSLKRFAFGQDIIRRLHNFLDQFRTRRHHYPLAESGNLE